MGRFLLRALLAAAPLAIVLTVAATCFGQVAPAPVLHAIAAQVAPSPAPDLPPGLNVTDVLNAIAAHQWLALVLLVAVYLRKLLSPGSAFPWTVPVNWRPAIVGAAGLVVAVVSSKQAGSSWESALVIGATGGALTTFLDGLVVALFGSPAAAPSWAKAILAIIEDVAPPAPPASGSGGGVSKAPLSAVVNDPPAAVRTRVGSRVARVVWPWALGGSGLAGAVGMASLPVSLTGCSAWWQELQTNPQAAVAQIIQYVEDFLTGAQALWAVISPLLGASVAPQANLQFNNAVAAVTDASAALQDAVAAAAAAQQSTPNFSALIANVQAAVQQVVAIVAIYTVNPDAGTSSAAKASPPAQQLAEFNREAAVIAGWRH
jgi:hypothetical protein